MEEWLEINLSSILEFPVPPDMTKYILQIRNGDDLDEYLKTLLDFSNSKHRQFVAELKRRQASTTDMHGYKKTNDNDNLYMKQNDKNKKGKARGKENSVVEKPVFMEKTEKKKKFVNLYSEDGKEREIMLKGRHRCECEARKHMLINNCLNCGRIVCQQEGSGPCLFCGELVCTPDQQSILARNTKQSDQLYNKFMDQKAPASLMDSMKHRDKLLEYDRNSAKRTTVIDDECDYFESNSVWLSDTERQKLQQKEEEIAARKHSSRIGKKVTLDFAGREVIEEDGFDYNSVEAFLESVKDSSNGAYSYTDICSDLDFPRPQFMESEGSDTLTEKSQVKNLQFNPGWRVQDKEYLEMSDGGLCLSMHQPYASLLVEGIKQHEGRVWYSSHRGRLWIAAAGKSPDKEEISRVENFYRALYQGEVTFPKSYPTGCLLGCVSVVDVLPQEEYREQYPGGESDSPYVFICKEPYKLPVKFPMQGEHKIYKIDKKIHHAATKALERAMQIRATS